MNEDLGRLTYKQQAFLDGLKEGKTQYQAFIDAGYSTKGKNRNYIDKEASILAKNRKIAVRLAEYQEEKDKELKEKQLWDAEASIKALVWMVNQARSSIVKKGINIANQKAFITSIKELNAIQGINFESQLKAEARKEDKLQDKDAVVFIGGEEELED